MKDIQSQLDSRKINIKKVGIKAVSYPITVRDKAHKRQHTIATANMYVNLPHRFKGTHMSRFIEILNDFHGDIDINSFYTILEKMKDRLQAEASHLEIEFPYFLKKNKEAITRNLVHYKCSMHGSLQNKRDILLSLEVPISFSLTEKSPNRLAGSLGRWGKACVTMSFHQFFWLEDIILAVEKVVEEEINGMALKRCKVFFLETFSKRIGACLQQINAIKWFSVIVHNFGDECSTFATVESQ